MAFRDDLDAHALRRKLDDDEVRLLSAFVQAEHARRQRVHATWMVAAIGAVVLMFAAWPGKAEATQVKVDRFFSRDSAVEMAVQQSCIRRVLRVRHELQESVMRADPQYVPGLDVSDRIEACLR